MRKGIVTLFVTIIFATSAFAYDADLAKKFDALFSQLTPEVIKMKPCQITTKEILEMIKKKEDFVILDKFLI